MSTIPIDDKLVIGPDRANIDARYKASNNRPYASVAAAEAAINLVIGNVGLTVLVADENDPDYPEAKEYWVQPYDNNGVTAYHLVEKGAGTTDYADLDNKPTISDGGQGSTQIPLSGNVKVTAKAAASGQTTGVAVTAENGGITMAFTLEKGADGVTPTIDPTTRHWMIGGVDTGILAQGADGQDGQDGAPAVNPFKGWYKTGDTLPTDGFDGAYLYFKDTSEPTGQTTIYRWNGTTYADTGTVVDESNVQTFGSGQSVSGTYIKDINGNNAPSATGVLSADGGKALGQEIFGVKEFRADMVGLQTMAYYTTNGRTVGSTMPDHTSTSSSSSNYACVRLNCSSGEKFKLFGSGGNDYGRLWVFTDASRVIIEMETQDNKVANGEEIIAPEGASYLYVNFKQYDAENNSVQREVAIQPGIKDIMPGMEQRISELENNQSPKVEDRLDSESKTLALSARQGNILNTYYYPLAGVYTVDGTVTQNRNNDKLLKIIKSVWIEVTEYTYTIPSSLRLFLFRNRSEGNGSNFIIQFCPTDNYSGSNVIFSTSENVKKTGVSEVVVEGNYTAINRARIHMVLDFDGYEDDEINISASTASYFIIDTLKANNRGIASESVKEAVVRIDKSVANMETVRYPLGDVSGVGTMGASLMFRDLPTNGNNWVEDGCKMCGVKVFNKAKSGVGIASYFADKLWRGTYCTPEEFEEMDILAIQLATGNTDMYGDQSTLLPTASAYVENFDENDSSNQFATYTNAQCLDYILKYWQERCFACKDDASSKWYGLPYGKPCRLMFVTHWHDGRVRYNESIRQVAAKWGGGICEFDKLIGFSKNQTLGGVQPSTYYAFNNQNIDGVEYGWHPLKNNQGAVYIQKRLANIFAWSLQKYFGLN